MGDRLYELDGERISRCASDDPDAVRRTRGYFAAPEGDRRAAIDAADAGSAA